MLVHCATCGCGFTVSRETYLAMTEDGEPVRCAECQYDADLYPEA